MSSLCSKLMPQFRKESVSPGLSTPTPILCNRIAMSTPELTPPQMNEPNTAPNILITSPAVTIDVVVPPTSCYQRVCALIT